MPLCSIAKFGEKKLRKLANIENVKLHVGCHKGNDVLHIDAFSFFE